MPYDMCINLHFKDKINYFQHSYKALEILRYIRADCIRCSMCACACYLSVCRLWEICRKMERENCKVSPFCHSCKHTHERKRFATSNFVLHLSISQRIHLLLLLLLLLLLSCANPLRSCRYAPLQTHECVHKIEITVTFTYRRTSAPNVCVCVRMDG